MEDIYMAEVYVKAVESFMEEMEPVEKLWKHIE